MESRLRKVEEVGLYGPLHSKVIQVQSHHFQNVISLLG